MYCPICKYEMENVWEARNHENTWFAGLYKCFNHGLIRASGSVLRDQDMIRAWHPACPKHGTERMMILDQKESRFSCAVCHRKIELRSGNLVTTWQPPLEGTRMTQSPFPKMAMGGVRR